MKISQSYLFARAPSLHQVSSCANSWWPLISQLNGSLSFFGSLVSLFPQIIETYRDKTVEGLSPYLLGAWMLGDITSFIGAILTKQLFFQIALALYFLLNDLVMCLLYYYYGVVYHNSLATVGHESRPVLSQITPDAKDATSISVSQLQRYLSHEMGNELMDGNVVDTEVTSELVRSTSVSSVNTRRSKKDLLVAAIAIANSPATVEALALLFARSLSGDTTTETLPSTAPQPAPGGSVLGSTLSWVGASCYVAARIPQLIKNYQRKSTDGISPFLFGITLLCNVTYNVSIFTSCNFIESVDKVAFFENALPFIWGSAGTIIFDLIYFYQYYVLYSDDTKLRQIEREIYEGGSESGEEERGARNGVVVAEATGAEILGEATEPDERTALNH